MSYLISDYLLPGEHLAISARDLCRLTGYEDSRTLRAAVERERMDGALILSSDKGYYLPALNDADALRELRKYVARQDSRLVSNRRAVKAARRKLHELERSRAGERSLEGM